jgi:membrane-bound serine protease (ClpP class)
LTLPSYALQVGVALILLAFVLFVVDLKVTNHGLPTVGGMVALVLGSLLFDPEFPYFWALLTTLVAVAILMGGILFVGVLREVPAARNRLVKTGTEGMIGEVGIVRESVGSSFPGWVMVHGERWRAIVAVAPEDAHKRDHEQVIRAGNRVQVVGLRDGKVVVLPFEPTASEQWSRS